METNETQEGNLKERTAAVKTVELTQLAGMAGAASILTVFISAVSSWAFARGFLSRLDLPAELVTLRSGIDFLPGMAFFLALVFVGSLAAGFITPRPKTDMQIVVRSSICVAIVFFLFYVAQPDRGDVHSFVFVRAISLGSVIAPTAVGFFYRSLEGRKPQIPAVFLVVFLVLLFWTKALYDYGYEVGSHVVSNEWSWFPTAGMVEVKPEDFPRVSIRTKEKLLEVMDGERDGDGYRYPSNGSGFVRFIIRDDSEYYFVGNVAGVARVFSIRKDLVSQILYLEEDAGNHNKITDDKNTSPAVLPPSPRIP